MAKLKTRTNQPVTDDNGLLEHIEQDGNTTEVGGDLEVDGKVTSNGLEVNSEDDVNINAPTDIHGRLYVEGNVEVGNNIDEGAEKNLVVSGSITQNKPNWKSNELTWRPAKTGIEATNIYSRFEVINNMLYLIVNIRVKNNSGEATNPSNIFADSIRLPEDIAKKVIDLSGNSVHDVGSGIVGIAGASMFSVNAGGTTLTRRYGVLTLSNTLAPDVISITIYDLSTSMADQDEIVLSGRIFLALL